MYVREEKKRTTKHTLKKSVFADCLVVEVVCIIMCVLYHYLHVGGNSIRNSSEVDFAFCRPLRHRVFCQAICEYGLKVHSRSLCWLKIRENLQH